MHQPGPTTGGMPKSPQEHAPYQIKDTLSEKNQSVFTYDAQQTEEDQDP